MGYSQTESRQISLFDFGFDENGDYVNIAEKKRAEDERYYQEYSFEEIIKGHESDNDFVVCASFHLGCVSQWGMTLDEIRAEIAKEAKSKCYHYGNMSKGIYAYSYRIDFDDGDQRYMFAIENESNIVVVRHCESIDDIITGKEKICYPALAVYMFDKTESGAKEIKSGYGEHKNDIRYKVLCDRFRILEFSGNRIYPGKKPKDFYECEYALPDFIKYWG